MPFDAKNNKLWGCDQTKGVWAGDNKLWDRD